VRVHHQEQAAQAKFADIMDVMCFIKLVYLNIDIHSKTVTKFEVTLWRTTKYTGKKEQLF
jgi:hypothetical protein